MDMHQQIKKHVELRQEYLQVETNWYRHLLTLAVGALVLLGSLVSDTPAPGTVRYFLAATWFFLGLGILSGAATTYIEVDRASALDKNYAEEVLKRIHGTPPNIVISAEPNWLLEACKRIMLISLLLAVVCLTGYSVISTLTAS